MAAEEMQESQKERAELMRQLDIERTENRTEKYIIHFTMTYQ
jgi:hypothetical protein